MPAPLTSQFPIATSEGHAQEIQALHEHLTVLKRIVWDLGGIAHEYMNVKQLNELIDNMLSKGFPSKPGKHLQRWIHVHRNDPSFKIHQVLGANVESLVPDCFGKFHDEVAVECQKCLDRKQCARACATRMSEDIETPKARINQVYKVSERASIEDITSVLEGKTHQIAKTLGRGNKVILAVRNGELRLLTTADAATPTKEATMADKKPNTKSKKQEEEDLEEEDEAPAPKKAPKKSKPAPEPEPEEDEEEEAEESEEEEVDIDEDEEEDEKPAKSKKSAKPAKEEKPAKAKKEKAPLNKKQQAFMDSLKTDLKDNKKLYAFAKKMGVKFEAHSDERISRMRCVMAVKAHLA